MTKYLLNRILRGLLSIVCVVVIVMFLIYSCLDRQLIFANDPLASRKAGHEKTVYQFEQWEKYGYLDYITYNEFLQEKVNSGELADIKNATLAQTISKNDNKEETLKYIELFRETYEAKGYKIEHLDGKLAGRKVIEKQYLFAHKDISVFNRMIDYFTSIFKVDNINTVKDDIADRGIDFTLYDPAYGGEKFSPAIMGTGTHHKYLFYCDSQFPYIHQNLIKLQLGTSYSISRGIDVFDTMTKSQGSLIYSTVTYPTGLVENTADDLHSATYVSGLEPTKYFDDGYSNVSTAKAGLSRMGYSFIIGILSVIMAYALGVPLGTLMALKKDKLIDKLGTIYIIFIIAVPSLAYIFLFKGIGGKFFNLPTTFDMETASAAMYILPIISLGLPSVANLMKWLRRYMIDQMNSDYVKFARSGGLSEGEIFRKHIFKNAAIPLVHGIPGSVLGSLIGAIITERVYVVPGTGNMLTQAINANDNGVIVGMTLFYAVLSVTAIILGDILMSLVDPRISFSSKAR